MFNRTVIFPTQTETHYVTRDVHEHRAPTDESVALLKEMEAAAQARIIQTVRVDDGRFSCVIHTLKNPIDERVSMRAVFSLNGKKMTADFSEYAHKATVQVMATGIRDAVAVEIANQCLGSINPALWGR